MDNELVVAETGEIIQNGIEYTKVGLTLNDALTYDAWQKIGDQLKYFEGAIQWWIGDWLNFGERRYGEMYTQALDEAQAKTWRNYKYVSSVFELSRRRDNSTWSHHQEVAALEPGEASALLAQAEEVGLSVMALRTLVRNLRNARLMTTALPVGKYRIIYADPPWQYENSGFTESAEGQYPTMPVDEICALPIGAMATPESVLFLWATNPLLQEAIQVMKAWGFEYKTNIAWIKDIGRGKGWYLKSKHELLLIGVRDNTPHPAERPDSAQEADRGSVHSKKPEHFYDLIESMYPDGNKIELFARNTTRQGWETWGNEP